MAAVYNDPDSALAGMARIGAPRVPMGNDAYSVLANAQYKDSPNTTLVPKQGAQGGVLDGPAGNRRYDSYALPAGMGDKDGAAYRTQMQSVPQTVPLAGATQANGRIIRSAVNRTNPNFADGNMTSY